MCPFVGYNRPSSILTVVDLPEPFGPSRPKTSPRRTSKSTSSTARALGRFQKSLKIFVRPRTVTMGSPFEDGVRSDGGRRSVECGVDSDVVMLQQQRYLVFPILPDNRTGVCLDTFVDRVQ